MHVVDAAATFFNRRWLEYTGLTKDQSERHGYLSAFHPDDRGKVLMLAGRPSVEDGTQQEPQSADTGSNPVAIHAASSSLVPSSTRPELVNRWAEAEVRICRHDSTYRWFFMRACQLSLGNEQGETWILTGTDIDNVKALKDFRQVEEDLHQARKEALQSAQFRGLFIANMSHEMRTPFSGVHGVIGLLEDTALDDEQREYVHIAKSSCEMLLEIINGILSYSKLEAGMTKVETIPTNVPAMVEQVVESMAPMAAKKGLELYSFTTDAIPPVVLTDKYLIGQILFNLVGNAVKFTDQGEVFIKYSIEHESATHITLIFEVNDTGEDGMGCSGLCCKTRCG